MIRKHRGNFDDLYVNVTGDTMTGSLSMSAGNSIATDEIKALSASGLKLYDDGGNGIFVEDGGNVGIGTTAPEEMLHLAANDSATLLLESTDTTISNLQSYGAISWKTNDNSGVGVNAKIEALSSSVYGRGELYFYTGTGGSVTEALKLTYLQDVSLSGGVLYTDESTSRVGINDTTPNYDLDLNGSARITGTLGVGGTPSAKYGISVINTFDTGGGGSTYRGISNTLTDNSSVSDTHYTQGINALVYAYTPTGVTNSGYITGGVYAAHLKDVGTISAVQGLDVNAGVYGAGGADVAGTITTLKVLKVTGLIRPSATITNAYGVYINGVDGTNAYDIYANDSGADNYFAGSVGIGDTTPDTELELNGSMTLQEVTAPSTPAATKCVIYAVDDGDSTTSLYVKFDDGTAVRIAGN